MALSEKDLEHIQKQAHVVKFKAGSFTFHDGDACENFVLLKSGSIKVQKNSDTGRMVVLYHVDPMNLCILTTSCLLGHRSYDAEGVCETDVEALVLNARAFQDLMASSQSFREYVFSSLSSRLGSLIAKINDVLLTSLDQRVARILLSRRDEKNWVHLTHQDIAAEAGSAREVISRHLKKLSDEGLIEMGHGRIEIKNPQLLQQFA